MKAVKTAVILAAGRGTRLLKLGQDHPKGFLTLGQVPIIEESVLKLIAGGIETIWIVTGYMAHYYQQLARHYAQIRLVHNAAFAESGSMYSLYQLHSMLDEDFVLLESDLIYQQRGLSAVLQSPNANCLLMSGQTQSGDEVWIQAPDGLLQKLSKTPQELSSQDGELVGITRISAGLYAGMCNYAADYFAQSLYLEYEMALAAAAVMIPVPCLKIDDLVWTEIDTGQQLARAESIIYPRIHAEVITMVQEKHR